MKEISKKFVNGAELGRMVGVTKQAIFLARKKGSLVQRPDNRFDVTNPVNLDYIRAARERLRIKKQQKKLDLKADIDPRKSDQLVTDSESAPVLPDKKSAISAKQQGRVLVFSNEIDRAEAERRKTIEQVEALRIKNYRDRSRLLDRKLVERVFDLLYQIDVNRFRMLPARIASPISAAAQIDDTTVMVKIEEIINTEVFKVLAEIKQIFEKFLMGLKAEETKNNLVNDGNIEYSA